MFDRFDRRINYLRISVTDRCNLRCVYCMPAEGVPLLRHEDILTFDEIVAVVKEAAARGVDKIRITGGEPLVRKNVTELVRMIASIQLIRDLSMTTNGLLLEQYANGLKKAGLQRVNISLDTTDPEKYRQTTRGGDIRLAMKGIDAAVQAGLTPVKLNCVIKSSVDEPDAFLVRQYGEEKGMEVRYIHEMNLDNGYFLPVIGGDGGNCQACNRLRLTSNGLIKPCLFSNSGFSVREYGPSNALDLALGNKPQRGGMNTYEEFYNLGG
jgi:cyclic pyranopterin phosphate synthase